MFTTQIIGTGSYLPGDSITVETLKKVIGHVAEDLVNALGAHKRYWAIDPETGVAREDNSDIAAKAARLALENAEIQPNDIDVIISVTATPDYPLPANAPIIQEKLGIQHCAAIELRAGCNGVAQALTIADQFLKTGLYKTALVIGSELSSTYTVPPYLRGDRNVNKNDLLNVIMFGDGAGAVVLKSTNEPSAPGIIGSYLNSIGVGKPAGFVLPVGGSKRPIDTQTLEEGNYRWFQDYKSIAQMDKEMAFDAIRGILEVTKVSPEEIDMIIVPQANAERIKVGLTSDENPLAKYADRFFVNVDQVGNTSAAGVLIALDEANRRGLLNYNDLLMLVGAESSKWLCGSLMLRWAK
ncbi:3-oxoacyl-ACP synthase III family protein [Parageobacillus thermoglucosidasius]|uniref:Beta-ketoacyl-[acyl-carrier-protein] synthase III n=1 Tax=Parageobacillus thermoglucosidasius TaxID=1426 RepID=A0AAN0YMK5_PARTM|nr:ketoacyl-ACP synthase III [Parageobacillus thermoglucosidasius]AEH49455.1 Beta-ketoacyl-acyl-carrier-protein synthase III [Parageobacillus thermoglucosidasius C56-YS93]ALF09398.1 hypothetical protein AOT13_04865 [Parageobacillus thermoglucosidasius]ANZ29481.1 hypothetical protein BCV53_04875 [Parageobacillus thermoglucosidasius]APM80219.1 hypothetical protein BCV54_04880 [Parageobacillus thermoglucosidasius]KJX70239.1 hypothetical protein WH82_03470 [Parageobacillus thermoglucosidasius]